MWDQPIRFGQTRHAMFLIHNIKPNFCPQSRNEVNKQVGITTDGTTFPPMQTGLQCCRSATPDRNFVHLGFCSGWYDVMYPTLAPTRWVLSSLIERHQRRLNETRRCQRQCLTKENNQQLPPRNNSSNLWNKKNCQVRTKTNSSTVAGKACGKETLLGWEAGVPATPKAQLVLERG